MMLRRKVLALLVLQTFLFPTFAFTQTPSGTTSPARVYAAPKEIIDKIKDEGMNRSQVMQTLSYLTDVIGGRLTGSPNLKRANEWTRETFTKWGLQNAKLEPWGPFGRGWELKDFKAEVIAPYSIPVIGYPKAWSPSTKGTITSELVYFDAKTEADFDKYKGQLKGKIVLVSDPRELKAEFNGLGSRLSDEELTKLAAEPDPATIKRPQQQGPTPEQIQQFLTGLKRMNFILQEGAAVLVDNSFRGSGGTVFVSAASVAQTVPQDVTNFGAIRRSFMQPYQKEAEAKLLPQFTLATEDYNRLVRMIKQGVKPTMSVNIETKYYDDDPMAYNTVAEIPGSDPALKDQLVMLGGHLDSWHSATGTTDDGAGVAVAMEAVRILQAAGLKPRRTVRIALWTGEEQGLLGSRAYIKQRFGEMKGAQPFGPPDPNAPKPELIKGAEYDKLSAYFNLDNGTGKIRGVYMQGNANARPYFETWLAPFGDTGAKTLTMSNTGGTDHLAYDAIGLPGFQFIQDEIEYDERTHHSNQDVFDRAQADDLKQAATIMATFVYQTAMMDEKFPKKAMK